MKLPVKICMKRYMTDTIKHIGYYMYILINFLIYFNILSCSSKKYYFILDKGCNWPKLDTSAEGRGHKIRNTHLESDLPICYKLWDIGIFLLSLITWLHFIKPTFWSLEFVGFHITWNITRSKIARHTQDNWPRMLLTRCPQIVAGIFSAI